MADQTMFGFNFLTLFLVLFFLISRNSGEKIIHNGPTLSLSKDTPNSELRISSLVGSTDGSQTGNVWPFARNRRGVSNAPNIKLRAGQRLESCVVCLGWCASSWCIVEEPASQLVSNVGLRSMRGVKKHNNKNKSKTTDKKTPTETSTPRRGLVPEGHTKHAPPKTKDITGFPNLEHVSPKSDRKRWRDPRTNEIFEWDSAEGELEKYNPRGKHLGSFDPFTGNQRGPAEPGRTIEV